MDVIFEDGREAVVGLDPVECAVDLGRDSAIEFKVEDVPFEAGRLVESLEYAGRWVDDTVGGPDPVGIVREGYLRGKVEYMCHSPRVVPLALLSDRLKCEAVRR